MNTTNNKQRLKTFFSGIGSEFSIPIIAVILAFLVGSILMAAIDIDPLKVYKILWLGVAGGKYQIGLVLVKAVPLIVTGLGLSLAFRCGVFNIGGEGQIYMGALAGTFVGIQDLGLPAPLHIFLTLLAGFIGGGLWGAFAGYLKAKHGVNEIITTILLNYIAVYLVSYFTHGPLKEDQLNKASLPQTAEAMMSSRLPMIWEGTRLHLGFVIAIALAIFMYFLLFHTSFGYRARAVGYSASSARYAGILVVPTVVLVMLISGGLAGVAGTMEVIGVQRRLRDLFLPGTGYTAIAIALLGRNHPFGIIFAGILFGALEVGAINMEALAGVPSVIAQVIQATVIFFVAIGIVWKSNPISTWFSKHLRLKKR